ncbi:DUF1573 domain-containing protein [bacterium]|nr:DUF1573 domain-containing protein [bacterium]
MVIRDAARAVSRAAKAATSAAALAALFGLAAGGAMAAPSIRVNPPQIELGQIESGMTYERTVEVTNAGDGILVITDVKTSCGCTAAAVDGVVELAAGQKQTVRVTFDSKNMDGEIHKNVIISSTDPELPKVSIPLLGMVHKAIRWEPKYVALNNVYVNQPFEQVVQLQTDHSLGVEVKEAYILGGRLREAPTQLFDLEQRPVRQEGERDIHEFVVRLREGTRPRRIAETMHVVTNQPAPNDTLNMPVRGEVRGRIRVVPNFVVFPMVGPGEEARRDLTLTSTEGTFQVLRAEVANSPVTAEIVPHETGRQTVVRLLYTGQDEPIDERRTLTIETDDPDQQFIEMQVRYQTRLPDPDAEATAAARAAEMRAKVQGPK